MKRAAIRYTLDLFSSPDCPPIPGGVLLRKSASGQTRGYYRLESVRKIKVNVSRGETARYALDMTPLPDEPAPGARLLVVVDHPRRKKSIANNRFSPLLDWRVKCVGWAWSLGRVWWLGADCGSRAGQ